MTRKFLSFPVTCQKPLVVEIWTHLNESCNQGFADMATILSELLGILLCHYVQLAPWPKQMHHFAHSVVQEYPCNPIKNIFPCLSPGSYFKRKA